MYKSFFDKIAFSYLIIIVAVFAIIIIYASNVMRDKLIEDKQTSMETSAHMIIKEYIEPYRKGELSIFALQHALDSMEEALSASIWYTDPEGNFICVSNPKQFKDLPKNLYSLDYKSAFYGEFTKVGTFYGTFSENVLTYGTPIDGKHASESGLLILHINFNQISDIMRDMIINFIIPLCIIIILCMFFLLYLMRRIISPLNQLNQAARAYALGNFEAKTGITSDDEVGELAANLEYMASELKNLDEYRKSFVSNISHDFRSPLTSIKGYIEAMLDGTIPKDNQEKYLNIVLSETQRLTKLTSSLIEMSNNDSAGIKLNFINFNIKEVINPTVDLFEGVCQKRYIVIHKTYKTEDFIVRADKTRIQQVLYNLVDNAVKFSPHGATITITVSNCEDPTKLQISVKDTGKGIDKEQQAKVFDRFFKGDISRGKDKQGSGLGLAIIKEIVRAHGENITLESIPDKGSEFTFRLKKADDQSAL